MYIDVDSVGKKVIISLHRGYANALNLSFLNEILDCIDKIENNAQISIVVISSKISNICSSGLDLGELFIVENAQLTKKNIVEAVRLTYEINQKILNSKHIYYFIANGMVIGSAVSIMLACDFRVAADNSWIWMPDVQYGGLLADGGLDLLSYRCTSSIANQIGICNKRFNAMQLRDSGVFDWICKKQELELKINSYFERMEKLSLLSMSLTKKILNQNIKIYFHEELMETVFDSEDIYLKMSQYIRTSNI